MVPRLLGIDFRSVRCIFEAGRPTEISIPGTTMGVPPAGCWTHAHCRPRDGNFRRSLRTWPLASKSSLLLIKSFQLFDIVSPTPRLEPAIDRLRG